jgi:hypothetical protein
MDVTVEDCLPGTLTGIDAHIETSH